MARKRRKRPTTGNPLIDPAKFFVKDGKLMPREKPKKPKKPKK